MGTSEQLEGRVRTEINNIPTPGIRTRAEPGQPDHKSHVLTTTTKAQELLAWSVWQR